MIRLACLILNHFDWKMLRNYEITKRIEENFTKRAKKMRKILNLQHAKWGGGWSDGVCVVCVWGVLTKCAVYKCVQNLYVLRINLETLVAGAVRMRWCACVCVCTGV